MGLCLRLSLPLLLKAAMLLLFQAQLGNGNSAQAVQEERKVLPVAFPHALKIAA